jgi:hypothetical protein
MRKKLFLIILIVIVMMTAILALPSFAYASRSAYMTISYGFADEPVSFNLEGYGNYTLEIYGPGSYISYSGTFGEVWGTATISTNLGAGDYGVIYSDYSGENVYPIKGSFTLNSRPYILINSPLNEPIIPFTFPSKDEALNAGREQVKNFLSDLTIKNTLAGYDNGQYLGYLYNAIFHRFPDDLGYNSWLDTLNNGMSRDYVLNAFINSPEFEIKYVIQVGGNNGKIVEDNRR